MLTKTETTATIIVLDPDLMNEIKSLKEKFLAVEEEIQALMYRAKTMDELRCTEQKFIALVKERHALVLRCWDWARKHHTDKIFTDLDELFNLQEKLVKDIAAAHAKILHDIVYRCMGYPH